MLAQLSIAAAAAAFVAALSPAIAPAASYDDDTVIVSFRPQVERPRSLPLLERAGVQRTVDRIVSLAASVVRVQGDPLAVAERLEESPKVAYAEPNDIYRATAARAPNDASFHRLWGLRNTGQTGGRPGADISAVKGWQEAGVGGYPARGGAPVAIIDTGIDRAHPDLLGRTARCREEVMAHVATGTCLDDTGHGTHVAGILGAAADNGVGVTGVAFNSPLLVCRALGGRKQQGLASDIAKCITWAHARGARVISMSFADDNGNRTLHRALRSAWEGGRRGGSVLVAAAGNGGFPLPFYPAAYDEVMSVSATNHNDRLAGFSNRHRTVDVAAPGADILSTTRGGGYERLSGTSMAVPYVSGVAAHVRRLHQQWPASRVRKVVRQSADDLGPSGHDPRFGFGRVNLTRAARR